MYILTLTFNKIEYAKKKYKTTNYTSMSFSKEIKIILWEYYIKSHGISYYKFPDE